MSIDGFYINYLIATRAGDDYMITTVDGGNVRSFVINYLQSESSYDFKIQSFKQAVGAGKFSPLVKGRTGGENENVYRLSRILTILCEISQSN